MQHMVTAKASKKSAPAPKKSRKRMVIEQAENGYTTECSDDNGMEYTPPVKTVHESGESMHAQVGKHFGVAAKKK